MNNKISQLVDHQVFQQLQSSPTDHPIGKGTIIFANSFTGTPVDMDQRVRDVLTSESIFIGNNPIVQLQKAFERLEKGPWYIDCRGDVLYIHNKPYSISPVHNYIYASENGEVLSISFKTQYRTKNATRGATMSFDSFKKTMKTTSTGISIGSEQEIADQAASINGDQLQAGTPNYMSPDIENERGYLETHWRNTVPSVSPQQIQAEIDKGYKEAIKEDYEYMKNQAPEEVFINYVQSYLNSKNMGRGSQGETEFRDRLKEVENDPSKVQSLFEEYFSGDTVNIDNGTYRVLTENKSLSELIGNGTTYIPAYNSNGRAIGASYVVKNGSISPLSKGDFTYSIEHFLKEKGASGKNKFVVVSKPTYKVNSVASGSTYSDVRVQVAYKKKSMYGLSTVQLMTDYYSRYLDSPTKSYIRYLMNNAMNNNTRKITEKRLEVEMRVVGRPSLTTSTKVHIENVGSRSGDYHIKRVIHRLSSDGYTCSLTLSPASYKVASDTNSIEIGVGKSKPTKRTKDGGEEVKPTNGGITVDLGMMTRDELEYFESKNSVNERTNIAMEVVYNLYLRANDKPGAQKRGVYHKHVQMDGNEVTKVWYTSTLPPHDDDYEKFKVAYSSKFYDLVRRQAENYKRYSK